MTDFQETAPDPIAREIAGNCLGVRARSIGRAISTIYEEAMRHHGATMPQVNMMALVGNYGTATPPFIARALAMDKSTVSRNLDRMVGKGWIAVNRLQDGRGTELHLTEAGAEMLARVAPDWRRANERVVALLGEENSAALRGIFDALYRANDGHTSSP